MGGGMGMGMGKEIVCFSFLFSSFLEFICMDRWTGE